MKIHKIWIIGLKTKLGTTKTFVLKTLSKSSTLREALIKEKKLVFNLTLLLAMSLMPFISEYITNQQIYKDLQNFSSPLDPAKAGELAQIIGEYTPGLIENSDDVAFSYLMQDDSYTLTQQLSINATRQVETPQRVDATYTVQKGESIMLIAQKFDLHVASILDANNLKPEDANKIKPGDVLNIPSSDTSTSNDWLVTLNKIEEEAKKKRQLEEAKRQQELAQAKSKKMLATSKQTSSGGYTGVDNSGLIIPISSRGISQRFGGGHTGIDYMANIGTPVSAAASGKVVILSSGWSGGYGNQIVVDHGGGRATRYAHLSSFNVSVGSNVSQGQTIGYSGSTGRSTGPHLHFELIINGRPVPPF
ncbi:MAG: M23 family metallopeptidase [Candidatus Berkelbacteria bacterium]|nr:M23 family metallopeptidase [Candidatus Berkelbacteria bacterium]